VTDTAVSDFVVVGAGHNALVCAGYLARAGYAVHVVERRPVVGGAVVTEEIVPGFRFDLGGSAHILINHTTIVQDLELERHGLEYIDLDPLFFAPFPDGSHITIWRDLDRTCQSIAAVSERDAEAYASFVAKWEPVAETFIDTFLHPPSARRVARSLVWDSLRRSQNVLETWRDSMLGYGALVRRSFTDPRVRAVIGWMAAQSGPPPGEALSGPLAMWHPLYHRSGMRRPRGGSGMLTQALARMIEAHGGTITTGAPVTRIIVDGGRAAGVECEDGTILRARNVVSGAHVHTTLGLLDDDAVPPSMRRGLRRRRVGNGFGMVVRFAMDELPDYTALPTPDRVAGGDHHDALQFVCPDMDYLDAAYADFRDGRPSRNPALVAMTFSRADPTLAPPGKHTLFLWGQYYPYELASGEHWDEIGDREADRMLETLAAYAPNVRGAVIDRLVETPLYLERELGLPRGNVMHLEMSSDQMFIRRPAFGMHQYRTPIAGLYLTGASTHPGGGIMGAAGQNASRVILDDQANA
jgi:phytoene dehydrogenase-like protein